MSADRNPALPLVLGLGCGVLVVVLGIALLPVSVERNQKRLYRQWSDFSRLATAVVAATEGAPPDAWPESLAELHAQGMLPEDLYRFAAAYDVQFLPVAATNQSAAMLRMPLPGGGYLVYTADHRCFPVFDEE